MTDHQREEELVEGLPLAARSFVSWSSLAIPDMAAYFERDPLSTDAMTTGGSWPAYCCNGYVYSNDIAMGLDVLKLSDRRTDPAKRVRLGELNVQSQPDYFD